MISNEFQKFIKYSMSQARFLVVFIGIVAFIALIDYAFDLSLYGKAFGYVENLYARWGLAFIFIASIAEGILLLNWYFPGNIIVLTGALLSRRWDMPFWEFGVVVFLGFYLAFFIDYLIGRYGLHRVLIKFDIVYKRIEAAQRALEKNAIPTFFTWYIHSQSGNFVATAAGVLKYPFLKFLSLNFIALLFWIGLWLGLVYIFGDIVVDLIERYFYVTLLLLLSVWLLIRYAKNRKHIITPISQK